MMLTDLADVLREARLPVYEMPGWQWRGHDEIVEVRAVMAHHTGSLGMPGSLNVVRDGHPQLAGPLAQLGLAPDGTFWVIAAGVCWHAGTGQWGPLPWNNGNYYAIGIEGVSNGRVWTPQQRENYPKGCAALCRHYGLGADRVCGHKEYSNAGKWDPGNWDMNAFRADVARYLSGSEEDDLRDDERAALFAIRDQTCGVWDNPRATLGGPGHGSLVEMVSESHMELTQRHPNRIDGQTTDTMAGYSINADAHSFVTRHEVADLKADVVGLRNKLDQVLGLLKEGQS